MGLDPGSIPPMDKATAIEIAQYLSLLLEAKGVDIEQTILFGSCARDEAQEESDVDIAIVSWDFEGKTIFERADLMGTTIWQTVRQFRAPIDVLNFTPEEFTNSPSLAAQFARTGIRIAVPSAPVVPAEMSSSAEPTSG